MPLVNCPECGHEISSGAVACPNCGRPLSAGIPTERPVVVSTPRREDGVPKWIFIPIAVLGGLLLLVLFLVMNRESGEDDKLAVNVNARRTNIPSRETATSRPATQIDPQTSSSETQTVTVPGSQSDVSQPNPTRGTVMIDAKVTGRSGSPAAVRRERFYLLDKDVESILSESNIEPIDGQTLSNSLGLSVLYPDRYGSINRAALSAIQRRVKYAGTTDESGKLQITGVEPDSYYLFGITKVGNGFAMWSSPVSIIAGENNLNLTPQRLTELAME